MARKTTTKPKAAPAKQPDAKAPAQSAPATTTEQTNTPAQMAPDNKKAPASVFDQAVEFVLSERIEGGYVNDPRDRGGETNFGIAKKHNPGVDIKNLSRAGAIAIYKENYWDSADCDKFSPKLSVAMFDCSVNQGPAVAKRVLQTAVGAKADGIVGKNTMAAVEKFIAKFGEDELIKEFLGWRLRRYAFTPTASTHMRGWANRILLLQKFLLCELEAV